jgi:hypothetical protein
MAFVVERCFIDGLAAARVALTEQSSDAMLKVLHPETDMTTAPWSHFYFRLPGPVLVWGTTSGSRALPPRERQRSEGSDLE